VQTGVLAVDKEKVLQIASQFIKVIDIRCDEIDRISIRSDQFLEFAAAIEAATREECAKLCQDDITMHKASFAATLEGEIMQINPWLLFWLMLCFMLLLGSYL
jgi:hypothetical protein